VGGFEGRMRLLALPKSPELPKLPKLTASFHIDFLGVAPPSGEMGHESLPKSPELPKLPKLTASFRYCFQVMIFLGVATPSR